MTKEGPGGGCFRGSSRFRGRSGPPPDRWGGLSSPVPGEEGEEEVPMEPPHFRDERCGIAILLPRTISCFPPTPERGRTDGPSRQEGAPSAL